MCKTTSMIVVSFLKSLCLEPTYTFLLFLLMLLLLGPQLCTSTLYPKLTLPLEGAISFIGTITFRGLSTLIILKFFNVTFITCHIGLSIVT